MHGPEEDNSGSETAGRTWPERLFEGFFDGIGELFFEEGGLVVLAVLAVIILLVVGLTMAWERWSGPSPNGLS